MKNSFKQLLRTPAKAALFLLLTAVVSFLLVFSSVMLSQSSRCIEEIEAQFTTLGTISQPVASTTVAETKPSCFGAAAFSKTEYVKGITLEELNFPGVEYVAAPENRPYYVAKLPELTRSQEYRSVSSLYQVAEFTALEDGDEFGGAPMQVTRVLYGTDAYREKLAEGTTIFLCQCLSEDRIPVCAGRRYVASVVINSACQTHGVPEYVTATGPYTTQHDPAGNPLESEYFGEAGLDRLHRRIDEVTDGFWESEQGKNWLDLADFRASFKNLFYVTPTNSLDMLPVFQKKQTYVREGREITAEEFESGALVCMLSDDLLSKNFLKVGDKISLPLTYALYGVDHSFSFTGGGFYDFGPFDAQGKPYEPFWEAEYEIVGTFQVLDKSTTYEMGRLPQDMFIIPAESVKASDANNIANFGPMNASQVSFLIPNGTVAQFDAALREAVPAVGNLEISYNDNGYTDILKELQATKLTAVLLFASALLASVAVISLLLYFFIVKQKKRTAIERSLGMTKRQCRVSLIAGVLALTVFAAALGSGGAAAARLADTEESRPLGYGSTVTGEELAAAKKLGMTVFSTKYSPWAAEAPSADYTQTTEVPTAFYFAVPILLSLIFLIPAVVLVNRNLKIDPMLLLSTKTE